ncbi:MAG: hypothetical protein HOC23_15215 [Halieaceae bacterium]|nr:hypothetical protein [Halieaceae bacterium]
MDYPLHGITACQLGLVVRDIDKAVQEHSEVYGIKQWFRVNIQSIEYYYQGQREHLVLDIVMGYCKGTQIELIQVLEGERNIYVDLLLKENLIHSGVSVRDFDNKIAALKQRGYKELHHGTFRSKGLSTVRMAYFDCRKELGYILEILEVKCLGINLGMPKFLLQAGRLTGDASLYKPRQSITTL